MAEWIFWDDERGLVVPRPMTQQWHTAYKKQYVKNPDQLNRFFPIGQYNEAALKRAVGARSLQEAKDAVAGVEHTGIDPYADVTETTPPDTPANETPPPAPEPEKKPFTKDEIMDMKAAELRALLTDFGIPSRKMRVAEMKDKLVEITLAE